MHSWSKFWAKDTKRPGNPTDTFEEPGTKALNGKQKRGTGHAPCIQHHLRGGQTT